MKIDGLEKRKKENSLQSKVFMAIGKRVERIVERHAPKKTGRKRVYNTIAQPHYYHDR